MENDLCLISTESLIDELEHRFEAYVLIGKKGEEYTPEGYWWDSKGTTIETLGLIEEVKFRINEGRETEDE